VDLHAGIASAGLQPDGRQVLHRAQEEAKSYRGLLDQPIPGHVLSGRLSLFMQVYTLYSSVRPFGTTALLAIHDHIHGSQLYMVEPSGQCSGYHACAVGKGKQLARAELEKLDFSTLDVSEAVHHAARIIYLAHDESKDKDFELEMSWISPQSSGRHEPVPQDLLSEAEKYAKSCLEGAEEEEAPSQTMTDDH
jgi:20S proteasome subunit alpha 7